MKTESTSLVISIPMGQILAPGSETRDLIFEYRLCLIQHAADKRALTIVYTATSNKAQQFFTLVLRQVGINVSGDKIAFVTHGKPSLLLT